MKEKLEFLIQELKNLYPEPKRPLNFETDFEGLVSVMLSAQCTDKRVNEITKNLFLFANTPEDLIKLGEKKLKSIIKKCGMQETKTKNLLETSKMIISEYKNKVPENFDDLLKLPGVGGKTAAVVLMHCFGVLSIFPVDTHIFRITNRIGIVNEKTPEKTSAALSKIFPKKYWQKLHLQIIFFGREICTARSPKCNVCDLKKICNYYSATCKKS